MLCGKAGFELRTLGTKEERYDHCATRPVPRWMYLSPFLVRRSGDFRGKTQKSQQNSLLFDPVPLLGRVLSQYTPSTAPSPSWKWVGYSSS